MTQTRPCIEMIQLLLYQINWPASLDLESVGTGPSSNPILLQFRENCLCFFIRDAYHFTEKSGWGIESIIVSDLPVYRRNTTSVMVWIQKKGEFELRESGTEKEPRNWLMVSNIPFGSYQPEWKDYFKTLSSIFGRNFRKVTLPFTFHPELTKFSVKW